MITVFIVTGTSLNGLPLFNSKYQTSQFARRFNILIGTSSCVTATTSIIATFVIGAQVYNSTKMNPKARRRYTHIIEITMQSSALYSLAILAQAIFALLSSGSFMSQSSFFVASDYISAIANITTVGDFTSSPFLSLISYLSSSHLHRRSWLLV